MSPEIPRLTLQWMLTQKSGRALDVLPADTIPRLVEANAVSDTLQVLNAILTHERSVWEAPQYVESSTTWSRRSIQKLVMTPII